MFNSAFDGLGAKAGDYYPPALQSKIDELNGWIYDNVNNGVYKAGFATSQQAYDEAVDKGIYCAGAHGTDSRTAPLSDGRPVDRGGYPLMDDRYALIRFT